MKHTGERWEQRGSVVVSPGHGLVCAMLEIRPDAQGVARYTEIDIGSPDWDEAMANCRLAAAAPYLLASCEKLLEVEQAVHDKSNYTLLIEATDMAKDAIAETKREE